MIVSIDIGTSYSSLSMLGKDGKSIPVAIGEDGTAWGSKFSLPSAVFVEDNGNILVGQAAMRSRLRKPDCFRMEFKRNLGEDTPLLLGGRSFRVEELYTELLLHMKACVKKTTGEDIELAYITCPATYRKDKKERLISAAKAAGLFQVELVPEPTAAAMSYVSAGYVKDGQTLLVYDFGGGTFDAALIQYKDGAFLPLGEPLGLPRCGGIDMDRLIYQDVMKAVDPDTLAILQKKQEKYLRFASHLLEKAVQIKHQLSSAQTATEFISLGLDDLEYVLDRDRFEEMIAPMIDQTIHVCEDALTSTGLEKSGLSAVVLVGGTSRVPLVQQMVQQFAGKVPVYVAPDVDLAVVQGALSYRLYNEGETAEKWYQDAKKLEEQGGSPEVIVDLYLKAAEQGYAAAQYNLGVCYARGTGIQKDIYEAVKWYRKAAEQGLAIAQFNLGVCFATGNGIWQNDAQATKWYRKAAEQGHADAQFNLGVCYANGTGVMQDGVKAEEWFQKAAEQGHADARRRYAMLVKQSKPVSLSSNGMTVSHRNEGKPNSNNKQSGNTTLVHKNIEKSTSPEQNTMLGSLVDVLQNVVNDNLDRDGEMAEKWYQDAKKLEEQGGSPEVIAALYRKAAEQGYAAAQYNLGDCYARGTGIQKDIYEAVKWYRKAAEQGLASAQFNLGVCFATGNGIWQNDMQAAKWYRKAAEQGHADAQFNLGVCYANGTGVMRDGAKAEEWFQKAAEQGNVDAKKRYDMLVKQSQSTSSGRVTVSYKTEEKPTPSKTDAAIGAAIAAGGYHTVGLKSDGAVVATGSGGDGQCNVSSWHDNIAVAAGYSHTVGLRSDGTVAAVGSNKKIESRRILGRSLSCSVPCGQCNVSKWHDIIAVTAGFYHTIGLNRDGTVVATGDNDRGQCNVNSWHDIIAVAAGAMHTVGLRNDGTVVATGQNFAGRCNVNSWHDIIAVAAGGMHTVALRSDGTLVATGSNGNDQCNVNSWHNIIAVAAGGYHTVGLRSDGTVVATGDNKEGQCNVNNWHDIIAVAAGLSHTVGLRSDGTVVATGRNNEGKCNVQCWKLF